jgi:poly(3-hydroxybutyrate) depolymerase
MQTRAIDAARVYVAGLSAGGAMAAILAREYPDLFAAAGIHSGVPPGVAHDVASAFTVMKSGPGTAAAWQTAASAPRPIWRTTAAEPAAHADAALDALPGVPVIVFHGDADSTVAAANGDAVIEAALAGDAGSVRADSAVPSADGQRSSLRSVWRAEGAAPDAPSLAEQWLIRGAAHAWSGGAEEGSYTDPAGPDASREMLRFFLEHPRRRG